MQDDRSSRHLIAAFLFLLAVLLAANLVIGREALTAYWLPVLLAILGALVLVIDGRRLLAWRDSDDVETVESGALALDAGTAAPALGAASGGVRVYSASTLPATVTTVSAPLEAGRTSDSEIKPLGAVRVYQSSGGSTRPLDGVQMYSAETNVETAAPAESTQTAASTDANTAMVADRVTVGSPAPGSEESPSDATSDTTDAPPSYEPSNTTIGYQAPDLSALAGAGGDANLIAPSADNPIPPSEPAGTSTPSFAPQQIEEPSNQPFTPSDGDVIGAPQPVVPLDDATTDTNTTAAAPDAPADQNQVQDAGDSDDANAEPGQAVEAAAPSRTVEGMERSAPLQETAANPTASPSSSAEGNTPDGQPYADHPAVEAAADAQSMASAITESAADDLTIIHGIGKKIAEALNGAGVTSYAALAAASPERLMEIVQAVGLRVPTSPTSWIAQAEFAARGDRDGMRRYVAEHRTE